MAMNSFYQAPYPQGYYGNPYAYQQMQQQALMQQQAQQAQQQAQAQAQQPIHQSGFIPVQSEQEARSYPVAPGNSITFKDETAPFCYVKTMGFNQLDRPTFERYRLVKEDAPQEAQSAPTTNETPQQGHGSTYATKDEISELWAALDALKAQVKTRAAKNAVTEEAHDDE